MAALISIVLGITIASLIFMVAGGCIIIKIIENKNIHQQNEKNV